jgi:hypothetical protein
MTNAELDTLWSRAEQFSGGFTRYRFAALVAAAERNRMIADGWRQCAQGQRTTQHCAVAEQARLEEREPRPEPISDAKIRAEFRDLDRHTLPGEMTVEDWFEAGVRFAERQHEIV